MTGMTSVGAVTEYGDPSLNRVQRGAATPGTPAPMTTGGAK